MSQKRNQFSPADKEFPWWHYSASREVFHRCLLLWQSCFALTYEEPQARRFVNCQETAHLTALLRHPLDSEKNQYSDGDLFGICVLEQMLTMFQGTQLGAQMRATFKKLSASLHEKPAVSWDALAEVVSFRTTITPARVAPEILDTLSHALMAHEEVEFFYSGLQREQAELRRVEPYHLLVHDGIWYFSAYDPARSETRRFLPLRMQQVRATGNFFERGERHTDPEERLQHSIGVFGGNKPEQIRLRLNPRGVRLFSERIYYPSQQITPTSDGGHELTMLPSEGGGTSQPPAPAT